MLEEVTRGRGFNPRRPAPPLAKMVRTLSSLEKGKRRNYVVSASKEACLLAEYRLGPLQ